VDAEDSFFCHRNRAPARCAASRLGDAFRLAPRATPSLYFTHTLETAGRTGRTDAHPHQKQTYPFNRKGVQSHATRSPILGGSRLLPTSHREGRLRRLDIYETGETMKDQTRTASAAEPLAHQAFDRRGTCEFQI
jgi:hypothetical protein